MLHPDPRKPAPVLGVTHSDPGFALPAGACDCHVHVFDPRRFPLAARRTYTPATATVSDLIQFLDALGLSRVVLVQPSPYGTDNRLLLHALAALGRRARGVAVIDRTVAMADLQAMHAVGVRGARLNLETFGESDHGAIADVLVQTADMVAGLNWHIQIHARLPLVAAITSVLARLPTPVVLDHFAYASPDLTARADFDVLLCLMASGKIYVKLSAAHRIGVTGDGDEATALVRALISANPRRVLWGSDWPHTGSGPRALRHPDRVEPFEPVDDGLALRRLGRWTSADERPHILVGNPAGIYDFAGPLT
jgi:predicted TIM-barrel fold metal-dependent hydrolase